MLAGIAGQVATVLIWTPLHELAHPAGRKGPRIVHTINRSVGRVRNHAAVWTTALVVPMFWIVRVAELGSFKEDQLNAQIFAANNAKALQIMDRAGWK